MMIQKKIMNAERIPETTQDMSQAPVEEEKKATRSDMALLWGKMSISEEGEEAWRGMWGGNT